MLILLDGALFIWVAQALGILWEGQTPEDPVQDLTERLRHPIRWGLAHPIRAMKRALR